MQLATIDIVVLIVYGIGIFGLAQYVSREKSGHTKDATDYFLASRSLPWWAIGASLIAANISAEQIWACPARAMRWDWPSLLTNGWRRWRCCW